AAERNKIEVADDVVVGDEERPDAVAEGTFLGDDAPALAALGMTVNQPHGDSPPCRQEGGTAAMHGGTARVCLRIVAGAGGKFKTGTLRLALVCYNRGMGSQSPTPVLPGQLEYLLPGRDGLETSLVLGQS